MTKEQKLAIQAEVAANPHLFSARHNRDAETIARELNLTRGKDAQLTAGDVAECMAEPAAAPTPQ